MRSSVPTGQLGQRTGGIEKQLLRAAEAGDAGSQYNLGILCDNGLDDNGPCHHGQPAADSEMAVGRG